MAGAPIATSQAYRGKPSGHDQGRWTGDQHV